MVLEDRERSFERKLEALIPFLRDQKDWRATSPLPGPFLPKEMQFQFLNSYLIQHSGKVQ